jgi:leucine dehydrogenase
MARFDAEAGTAQTCHASDADVYAPCAMGATLNDKSIRELKVKVVAGAANNQLAKPEDGKLLAQREILYAPDYVVNAGGVISTALEGPSFNQGELLSRVAGIGNTLRVIFKRADEQGLPTSVIADTMAQERLALARMSLA